MEAPSKSELKDKIEKLEAENAELKEKLEHLNDMIFMLQHIEWYAKITTATEKCRAVLEKAVPNGLHSMAYMRVDNTGYWFRYALKSNPNENLTYCVRHEEV